MSIFRKNILVAGWMSVIAAVAIGAGMSRSAQAAMIKPAVVGGLNDMTNNGGTLGYTLGLDLMFGVGMAADVTVGGEYLSRAFTGGASNVNYVHIPGIFFFHLGHVISLGGGGFYDVAVTSGASADYGVTGALRLKPGMMPLYLEGRFNYGLNTTNFATNTQEFEVLLGIVF